MLTFDTLKLEVPPQAVRGVNWDAFSQTDRTDMGTGQSETLYQGKSVALPVGVSSIVGKEKGNWQVTISAKTLADDYLKGITLDTFARGIDALSPVIQVDADTLWELNPKILKCDTTDNIPLEGIGSQQEVCRALLAGRANGRFLPVFWESRKKLGIEFRGTQQEKNRLIAYAKNLDLLKPQNRDFMKGMRNPGRLIQEAEKQIRFEVNHTAFRAIKDRLNISENTLQQVLTSKAAVNHDFLVKVLHGRGKGQPTLFDEFDDFDGSGDDFVRMKGIENIVLNLNADDAAVKEFFKRVYGGNFSYQYYKKKNSIRDMLQKMKAKELGTTQDKSAIVCSLVLGALLKAVA